MRSGGASHDQSRFEQGPINGRLLGLADPQLHLRCAPVVDLAGEPLLWTRPPANSRTATLDAALPSAFPAKRAVTWSERLLVSFVPAVLPLVAADLQG